MCINSIKLLWPGIRYTQKGVYSCAKIDVRLMGWDREGGTDRTLFTKVALLHSWHHACYWSIAPVNGNVSSGPVITD